MAVIAAGQPAEKKLSSGRPWCPGGREHCHRVQGHDLSPQISGGETHLVAVSNSGLHRTRDMTRGNRHN